MQPVIEVKGISKHYKLGNAVGTQEGDTIWALKDVSFTVNKGDRLGFVGRNGAGKSTLLKILSRVIYPSAGEARIRGRVTSLLEVGTGFLDHMTGRQNIYLNASMHGLSKKEITERLPDIITFSELGKFIDTPIKFYSSGMRSRLAFSVAAYLDPDILLLDEVLAVGDMAFAQKCLERVDDLTKSNRTILFVSHSMDSVRRFCTRAIWLDCGQVVMEGAANDVTNAYTQESMTLRAHQNWDNQSADAVVRPQPKIKENEGLPDLPHARLVSMSVLSPDGRKTPTLTVSETISIEVVYDILYDNMYIVPSLRLYNQEGLLVFNIVHHEAMPDNYRRARGRYRSVATVPAHLMAVGKYSVSVGLTTPCGVKLVRHQVEEDVVSFYVHEAALGEPSALGAYRSIKGAVRPMCNWVDEKLPTTVSTT